MSKYFFIILSALIIYSAQADHCLNKSNDVCTLCELGYYLDKSAKNVCKDSYLVPIFHNCNETENGTSCQACNYGYYLAKNGECVNTKNCKKSQKRFSFCEECDEKFYLLKNGLFCSSSPNCLYGDRETGKCTVCENGFYLDVKDNICKSNTEDNKFRNCKEGGENCQECVYKYYLGEDNLCSLSKNCSKSDQEGKCTKCSKGFYLSSLDNKCSKVENCSKVNDNFECEECKGYSVLNKTKCIQVDDWDISKFLNCKNMDKNGVDCNECKQGYFLNQKNNFCVLNKYMKNFKNCAKSDSSGDFCEVCEDGFYLGTDDKKCTSTFGCAVSKDDICVKCKYSFCLNSENKCIPNSFYRENSVFYKCLQTKNADTQCSLCENGYFLENGRCFDTLNCKERPNGNCAKCKNDYCLNNIYGCININIPNCERCDSNDIHKCTGCAEGYYLNEKKNICEKCKAGCATCTNATNCGSCEIGYFMKKAETSKGKNDAECQSCLYGCKQCYDGKSCVSCKEGYYVVKGNKKEENLVCQKCSEGCLECNGDTHCLKCGDGYYLASSGHSTFCLKLD
jgi:hypothetical protein